jgi:hypothetical protein
MMCRGTSPGRDHVRLDLQGLRRKVRRPAISDLATFVTQQERLASVVSRYFGERPAGLMARARVPGE